MEYLTLIASGFIASVAGIASLIGLYEPPAPVVAESFTSTEIGFTERIVGDPGRGVATPASGNSASTCTLGFDTPTLLVGNNTNVNMTLSRAAGETPTSDILFRCQKNDTLATCTRANSDTIETYPTGYGGGATDGEASTLPSGKYIYFYTGTVNKTFSNNITHQNSVIFQCPNTLDIVGPPMVTLAANPSLISYGDQTDLTYTVDSNPPATSCTADWSGASLTPVTNTVSSGPIAPGFAPGDPTGFSQNDPTNTQTFTVSCTNGYGTTVSNPVAVTVKARPNLVTQSFSRNLGTVDPVTGIYDQVTVFASVKADYEDVTTAFPWDLEIVNQYAAVTATSSFDANGVIPSIAEGNNAPVSSTFTDVFFGHYDATLNADLDPAAPGNILEEPSGSDTTDNTRTDPIYIDQPTPGLDIEITPDRIRPGESATISWNVNVQYEMSCTVTGANVSRNDIGYSGGIALNMTDTENTGPLFNEARYVLECFTPSTGNLYTDEALVTVETAIEEN